MYLNVGLNTMIKKNHIIGIFDIENTTGSLITKKFLAYSQRRNQVVSVGNDFPRSYILYKEKDRTRLYISSLSVQALLKRL